MRQGVALRKKFQTAMVGISAYVRAYGYISLTAEALSKIIRREF